MARVVLLSALALAACDLSAAALDYGDRYCAAFRCTAPVDGGAHHVDGGSFTDAGTSGDGGAPVDAGPTAQRADTALFRGDAGPTFVVLRLEAVPEGATFTHLEERRLVDGALVASEGLDRHGLALSTSTTFHGGLSRAGDGRSVTLMVYDGTRPVQDLVRETVVRRVLAIRRSGLDWSTSIADAFLEEAVFSAATHDGSTFWVSGNGGNGESVLHEVAAGSAGTSRVVLRTAPFLAFLSVNAGRLWAARHVTGAISSGVDDLGPAGPQLDGSTSRRLVSLSGQQRAAGFAALDLNPAVAGPDVLYVPSNVAGPGLRKYVFDGTTWAQVWSTSSATALSPGDGCLHVAARPEDGGVVVLCTADGVNAREVVRFDDFSTGDAGPVPRLLARIEGDGADGGVSTVFRGVAFSPD